MRVFICINSIKLEDFLKEHSGIYYIYPGEKNYKIRKLLDEYTAKEIIFDNYTDFFKDEFIRSYLDLIGRLGLAYNSIYWWSTFTSSKNKFISKLLGNLFMFYSITEVLRENPVNDILIINPPADIIDSIKKFCTGKSIDLVIFPYITTSLDNIKNVLSIFSVQLAFIFKVWVKIFISNIYINKKFLSEFNSTDNYYVLRSWFYSRSINEGKYLDSFFGTLPEYLIKKNQNLIIIAGIIGDYWSIVKKIAGYRDYLIIPQEFFLRYSDPIMSVIKIHRNKIRIKGNFMIYNIDITDIIKSELSKDYKYYAMEEYIHSFYIKRMLGLFDIGTFTTTYENNPWEKVSFLTLKKYSRNTITIGYQHAALSKASLNMVISQDEKKIMPIPDRIITTGSVTRNLLIDYGNFDPNRVREGCGLRFLQTLEKEEKERDKKYKVLVTPEGVLSESVNLVNFSQAALKKDKEYEIIIRPHPALPFDKFKNHLNFDPEFFPNISVSENNSVKKDLEEVDIVIYRGSSSSIEALMMGIPVIYVSFNDILSVDPLFGCSSLKWVARNEDDLIDAVKAIYNMKNDEYEKKLAEAKEYIRNYLYEITEERLNEFII